MGELASLDQLVLEIQFYSQQTALNMIEVGKRLIQAKEQVPHGEWGKWLSEQVDYTERTAQRFMRVATEASKTTSLSDLPTTKILALLDLPTDQRETFIEQNPVGQMTTRELQAAIKAQREAEQHTLKRRLHMGEPQTTSNTQVLPFDYTALTPDTADYLKKKETVIEGIFHKARFEVGKELKEAQEHLASHNKYEGVFIKWAESLGFKERTTYDLINYYKLVLPHGAEDRSLLESLPFGLAREIARPSASPELKQAVLNGDISTHKEYQAAIKAQREAEQQIYTQPKSRLSWIYVKF